MSVVTRALVAVSLRVGSKPFFPLTSPVVRWGLSYQLYRDFMKLWVNDRLTGLRLKLWMNDRLAGVFTFELHESSH